MRETANTECGRLPVSFLWSAEYKYSKIEEQRGPHMSMKATSETKIKLIVYAEFFLAVCAL